MLLATGLTDGLPDLPGLRDQWGAGVVHCPYCHGYEIRGRRIGVLGTGPMSIHQALLFRQWSEHITLFLNDTVSPTDEEWDALAARSVRIVDGAVTSVDQAESKDTLRDPGLGRRREGAAVPLDGPGRLLLDQIGVDRRTRGGALGGGATFASRQSTNCPRSLSETSWITPRPNCAGLPVMCSSVTTSTRVSGPVRASPRTR